MHVCNSCHRRIRVNGRKKNAKREVVRRIRRFFSRVIRKETEIGSS